MGERGSGSRWAVLLFGAVGVALGVWLASAVKDDTPEPGAPAAALPPAVPDAPSAAPDVAPPAPTGPRAPAHRIAAHGRLQIDANSLREGDVLALGLELDDAARGDGRPLEVVVVSVDGRSLRTTARPTAGRGSGVRLELDPDWLTPGRYMIQVSTASATHLPLMRYVLEVP